MLALVLLVAAADPSLVDRVVAQSLVEQGKPAEAKAVVPTLKTPAPTAVVPTEADATADMTKGEALLVKKDAKGALLAFRRALAKAPKTATPLWALCRASDALKDDAGARRYASLYVHSTAADRDKNTIAAAQWRLEQPEAEVPTTTAPKPLGAPSSIPTSATPPTTAPSTPVSPPY